MSRKYRQPGYQDSDREPRSVRRPPPPQNLTTEERIQRRSLRHATAREANEVIRCHHCGRSVQKTDVIAPETGCPFCAAPLHCCRTCRHFDVSARWQCRADITEQVGDKSKANRCPRYEPRLVLDSTGRRSSNSGGVQGGVPGGVEGGAREQFENLFKR